MSNSVPPRNWRSMVLFAVAALLVVATVPYHVPMQPAVSDSYIFGYNNHVGVALFLIFALAGAFWTRKSQSIEGPCTSAGMPLWMMWAAMAIAAVLSFALYRVVAPLNGFGESTYFLHRLHLLAMGRVPYRDFEFAYGAGFLYGPFWMYRMLHLSLTHAYYVFWMGCVVAGAAMLFYALRVGGDEREDRGGIFWVFYAPFLLGILTTGLNYTLLRFVAPVYGAVLVEGMRARERNRFGSSLAVLVLTVVLLLISPEMAVSFAMASVAYIALQSRWRERNEGIALGALVIALAFMFAVANARGVFVTMRAFSTGGNNFPIYFAPSIALLFAALWFGLHTLGQKPRGILAYWILLGVVQMPAALGRCDNGHIMTYALPLLFAVALVLSRRRSGRLWIRWGMAAYVVLIMLPTLRVEYIPMLATAAAQSDSATGHSFARWMLGERRFTEVRDSVVHPRIDTPAETYYAPFSYRPNGSDVVATPAIEYGYYEGLTNVLTPEQVRWKLREMELNPVMPLLLPRVWGGYCIRTAEDSRAKLSGLFGVPYVKGQEHEMDLYAPVCEFIRTNYRRVPVRAEQVLGQWDLWARAK